MRRAALSLAAAAIAALAWGAPARAGSDASAVLSPLGMSVLAPPQPVLGGDGRMHLVYEIKIANQSAAPVTVDSVQAIAKGEAIGRRLDAAALPSVLRLDGGGTGATIGAGEGAMLFMDVSYPSRRKAPRRLRHAFSISYPAGSSTPTQLSFTGVRTDVDDEPAVEIAPPVRGERWLVGNGCCGLTAHRAATLAINGTIHAPERFAIDLVRLNEANLLFEGPADQLASYPFFGAKVRSVAPGKVVRVQDGLPDEVPGAFPAGATIQNAGGNYVVVDIGDGRYAFYAHLQPGRLRVRPGDRVREGQVLGLLGNSGNSDGPHLHFHLMDSPSPLQSNGLPFTFTRYRGQGVVTDEAPLFAGQPALVDELALSGRRRAALPLNDQLIKLR